MGTIVDQCMPRQDVSGARPPRLECALLAAFLRELETTSEDHAFLVCRYGLVYPPPDFMRSPGVKRISWSILVALLAFAVVAASTGVTLAQGSDRLVLIVNPGNPLPSITVEQLRDLYLGSSTRVNGKELRPVNLKARDRIRDAFENRVLGLSPEKVAEHWKSQRFLGFGGAQPSVFQSVEAMKKFVSRGANAIGYIPLSAADGTVRIVPRVGNVDLSRASLDSGEFPFVIP